MYFLLIFEKKQGSRIQKNAICPFVLFRGGTWALKAEKIRENWQDRKKIPHMPAGVSEIARGVQNQTQQDWIRLEKTKRPVLHTLRTGQHLLG